MSVLKAYNSARSSSGVTSVKEVDAAEVINIVAFPGVDGGSVHYEKLFASVLDRYAKESSIGGYGMPALRCYTLSDPRVASPRNRRSSFSERDYKTKALAFSFIEAIEKNLKGPCILVGYSSYSARLASVAAGALQTKLMQGSGEVGLGPFSFVSIDGASPQVLEDFSAAERAEMMLDLMRYLFKAKIELDFSEPSKVLYNRFCQQNVCEQIESLKDHVESVLVDARKSYESKSRELKAFTTQLEKFIFPNMRATFEMVDAMPVQTCIVLATKDSQQRQKRKLKQNLRQVFCAESATEKLREYLDLLCLRKIGKVLPFSDSNGYRAPPAASDTEVNFFCQELKRLRENLSKSLQGDAGKESLPMPQKFCYQFLQEELDAIQRTFLSSGSAVPSWSIESDAWYNFLMSRKEARAIVEDKALELGWDACGRSCVKGEHFSLLDDADSLVDLSDKMMSIVNFHFKHIFVRLHTKMQSILQYGRDVLHDPFFDIIQTDPAPNRSVADESKRGIFFRTLSNSVHADSVSYADKDDPLSCSPPDSGAPFQFYTAKKSNTFK